MMIWIKVFFKFSFLIRHYWIIERLINVSVSWSVDFVLPALLPASLPTSPPTSGPDSRSHGCDIGRFCWHVDSITQKQGWTCPQATGKNNQLKNFLMIQYIYSVHNDLMFYKVCHHTVSVWFDQAASDQYETISDADFNTITSTDIKSQKAPKI